MFPLRSFLSTLQGDYTQEWKNQNGETLQKGTFMEGFERISDLSTFFSLQGHHFRSEQQHRVKDKFETVKFVCHHKEKVFVNHGNGCRV